MNQTMKRAGKWILFLLPFVIGTIGFLTQYQDGLLNAMYRSIRLYIIELDAEYSEVSVLIEIARWTAPMVTAAAIITLIGRFWSALRSWMRIRRHNAIAVHGNSEAAAYLLEQLKNRAVSADSIAAWKASRHILSFQTDREALEYLSSNREKLFQDDHKVYLCADTVSRSNYVNRNLVFCNFAEICARNYWREHPLQYFSGERRVAVIGFGNYGRQFLDQALLTNVYSGEGGIRYDVYGNGEAYLGLRTRLEQIVAINQADAHRDQIHFYPDWHQAVEELQKADRMILIDDNETGNLLTLSEISQYVVTGKVYCRVHNESLLMDLGNGAIAFGTDRDLYTEGCIIDEETLQDARRIHAAYYRNYQCAKADSCPDAGQCLTCPDMLDNWYSQSSFIIRSNIAQADHIPVKIQILLRRDDFRDLPDAAEKARASFAQADAAEKNRFSEIEHLRWCRYHYLNNWQYGPQRDNQKRIHPDLVPFNQLGTEAAKDLSTWENALQLYGDA